MISEKVQWPVPVEVRRLKRWTAFSNVLRRVDVLGDVVPCFSDVGQESSYCSCCRFELVGVAGVPLLAPSARVHLQYVHRVCGVPAMEALDS